MSTQNPKSKTDPPRPRLLLICAVAILIVIALLYACRPSESADGSTDAADGNGQVVLVMDVSGSMGESVGTRTRSEAANEAFDALLESLDQDTSMGLVLMPGGCSALIRTSEPAPLSTSLKQSYEDAVDNSTVTRAPGFGAPATPVGGTLALTAELFAAEAAAKTIVLISDGEEGCGQPPCDVASELVDQDFDVQVEAIGFQISDAGADQLRCVAETTGGSYHDITDADDLEDALRAATTGGNRGLVIGLSLVAVLALIGAALRWRI